MIVSNRGTSITINVFRSSLERKVYSVQTCSQTWSKLDVNLKIVYIAKRTVWAFGWVKIIDSAHFLILVSVKSTFVCPKHIEPFVESVFFVIRNLNCLTVVSCVVFPLSLQSAVSTAKWSTCSVVRIVYWKWEMDWMMSQSKCSVLISDRSQPSGLFAALVFALLSMWLFSGVNLFFLLTCKQRDKNWMWCQCVGGEVGYFFLSLLFDSDLLVL